MASACPPMPHDLPPAGFRPAPSSFDPSSASAATCGNNSTSPPAMTTTKTTTASSPASASAATTTTTTTKTTTVIRVKRRRDEAAPPPTLRIDGSSLPSSSPDKASHVLRSGSKRARRRRHHEEEAEKLARMLDASARLGGGGGPNHPFAVGSASASLTSSLSASSAKGERAEETTSLSPSPTSATSSAVFRRVATHDASQGTKRKSALVIDTVGAAGAEKASNVRVVEARLYSPSSAASADRAGGTGRMDTGGIGGGMTEDGRDTAGTRSKKPRLALTVVGSRTVSGAEFWGSGGKDDGKDDGNKENDSAQPGAGAAGDGGRSSARARMLRRAAAMTGGAKSSTSPAKKKKASAAVIFDPLTRAVDSSLLSSIEGGSVVPHLSFLRNNSTVQSAVPSKFRSLVNHAASDGSGTVLHVAALLNDVEGARMALDLGADPNATDGEGRQPEESAKMAGNDNLAHILAAARRGGDGGEDEEDDGDFVYDVYYLETTAANGTSPGSKEKKENGDKEQEEEEEKKDDGNGSGRKGKDFGDVPNGAGRDENGSTGKAAPQAQAEGATDAANEDDMADDAQDPQQAAGEDGAEEDQRQQQQQTVELRNGVGYWNAAGELVLEAAGTDLAMENGAGDSDNHMDDDEDSNSEGYAGNDYPEDEAYGSYHGVGRAGGIDSDDDDEDDGSEADAYYDRYPGGRHSPNAFLESPRVYCRPSNNIWDSYNANYDDDMSSDDDADYGINEFRNRPVNATAALRNASRMAASGGSLTGRGGVMGGDDGDSDGENGNEYRGPMVGLKSNGGDGWGNGNSNGFRQYAYDDDIELDS